jgi:hypothetical protein
MSAIVNAGARRSRAPMPTTSDGPTTTASSSGVMRWTPKPSSSKGDSATLSFVVAGPTHQTRGLGFLAFQLVEPGGNTPVSSGFDVAIVRDGVIAELYTVLTDPPR